MMSLNMRYIYEDMLVKGWKAFVSYNYPEHRNSTVVVTYNPSFTRKERLGDHDEMYFCVGANYVHIYVLEEFYG
jgi:hypothetical protein